MYGKGVWKRDRSNKRDKEIERGVTGDGREIE